MIFKGCIMILPIFMLSKLEEQSARHADNLPLSLLLCRQRLSLTPGWL